MCRRHLIWIATAFMCGSFRLAAVTFAVAVEDYQPGTGFATEYGTGLGYTNAAAALGEPNRETAFGAVTPFNPPFDRAELVSLGVDGSLVVRMQTPVWNRPDHPFGLDFIVYGSAGFVDVNYPNGQTDEQASLFGQNPGSTRVSVSQDNIQYYTLDPALAPVVDGFYPTDGLGLFGLPVNPELSPADLANQDLAALRLLYAGSAGGAGFDLSWAQDDQGQPVFLDSVQYLRIEVLSGRVEIDGFAAVPEPSFLSLLLLSMAGVFIKYGTPKKWAR